MKVQPIIDDINNISMHYFMPDNDIAIDESLVGSKGRNSLRQYLLNKYNGTKIWILADSATSYVLRIYVYEGKTYGRAERHGHGQGYYVVVHLMNMARIYNRGYHL